jgi:protein O-GlcNAc transferase
LTLSLIPPATDDPLLRVFREDLARLAAEREAALAERVAVLTARLETRPTDRSTRLALAACHEELGAHGHALELCLDGLACSPKSKSLWWATVGRLNQAGRTDDARRLAGDATAVFPGRVEFVLARHLTLPILYDTADELDFCRRRFSVGLTQCMSEVALDYEDAVARAVTGLGYWTNFYLGYQGRNDVELQRTYGTWVHSVMTAAFPQPEAVMRPVAAHQLKRRIGFLTKYMCQHSVGICMVGWLKHLSRLRFDIHSYHVGVERDSITEQFIANSDVFVQSSDLGELIESIRRDRLDVLIYLDIGMSPLVTQLAALRLAPVQCTTLGHSVTSGLPTIDYFLSSEWMEPPNAAAHYSETLVRLPGLGFSYDAVRVARPFFSFTRAQFGIAEEAFVYLCSQSPFKYLPQHDTVFVSIAKHVPKSQFVFVIANQLVAERFRRRLTAAFNAEGLRADNHCVILPRLGEFEYLQLYVFADVYLDSFAWSGCNTTLRAVSRHLPVVTCPGEFQRGRQSAAILQAMGVTETIATTAWDYVEIAVRLGQDEAFRRAVTDHMRVAAAGTPAYTNTDYIAALEEFLLHAAPRTL